MHGKGHGAVAALHVSLLRELEVRHLQLVPRGGLCSLKALETRRWAKELKSLNHGYKWKRVFEMFSNEVAEKQKRLEMF